ncbi:aluminum-activated malate transporter 10 [Telopea speciosissima]|uniref:aluminum-activated malate transporter 10 n=1 Tax=Telopea speciosissima TaxID=54955 RepID=UPI001CC5BA0B|nr:aluminum-activated malate transporter 10 [Telopea speciosissima]
MVNVKEEASGGLQWKVWRSNNESSELLVPESSPIHRTWLGFLGLLVKFTSKIGKFFKKAWSLGVEDPKKFIHCVKVGMALTIVSLFYYMRPLYDGVGGNAMWAVMTVVVVFEYSVGATLCKCLNRVTGTVLAGSLAVGVHWIASQSGDRFGPVILGASVFILASAATFSRFIPTIKARFDYGAMIFILTFSLVSVSGFRVEKLLQMAHQRVSTIAIGTSLCMLISMLVCPIWAGEELHLLITRNMEKLANSLDGCVIEYFKEMNSDDDNVDNDDKPNKSLLGYKCVLNSKGAEDSFANFARWEPAHGNFNFSHPWKQYLKIGASMRNCACCIEALNGCINSEVQAPDFVKKLLSNACMILSSHSSRVLKELAITMTTMQRSIEVELSVQEMKDAVQELLNGLKSLPSLLTPPPPPPPPSPSPLPEAPEGEKNKETISTPNIVVVPLMEVVPLVTVASLLIEIVGRIEGVVEAVNELENLADFKSEIEKPISDYQEQQNMKALQQV